ncbi:uncharacterized protein LOC132264937 [Phlebotomus argentipes]|uniref:uncharacterized protein LOC132264937 n=1 Tax=Phlebotomus argentipes TaxID=94469 RepID=UPI0028930E5C|nr:uncharacterized protein LOC132264937 [Phlebotomus argentipes]
MTSELVEEVPRFLNEAYIEGLVKKVENSERVKVEKYELKPVTKKGNHYASVMVRIIVNYVVEATKHKRVSLILKTTYDEKSNDAETVNFMKEFDVHSREMTMYRHILDGFHSLLATINDNTVFSAKRYTEDISTNTMVFEDLLERGYSCPNRIERLDMNHAKLALGKLAKFHATSIIYREKNPQAYATFNRAFLSRNTIDARDFCLKHYDSLLKVMSDWSGYEYYLDKLTKFRDNFVERGIDLCDPDLSDINVLLHGDFWSNNMMFKYDSAKNPIDVIFVDFQLPNWTTPAVDILYFIHTSMKEDLRMQKQDELVQYYYNILKKTLIDGYKYSGKFPTLHEFQVHILKKSLQIFISAFIVQPIIVMDENVETDLFILMDKDEKGQKFTENMYRNPHVVTAVKNLLPILDAKGILDYTPFIGTPSSCTVTFFIARMDLKNIPVPQWLTKDYIQKVLRKYKNDTFLLVKSFQCVQISGNRGEQFPSLMWRVSVEYEIAKTKTVVKGSYIVKTSMEKTCPEVKLFASHGLFPREVEMNEKIRPEMARILSNVGDNSQLFPMAIACDHEREAIVFQDLVPRGYKIIDKDKRLDLVHAEMVLTKLARMHAASVVFSHSEPEIVDNFTVGLLSRANSEVNKILISNLEALIDVVEKWEKFEKYKSSLKKIQKNFCQRGSDAYKASDRHINVLIHGDLWTKNVLFKYNSKNEPIDVLLVDLQFCCWTSPAVDLLYFFHTSLQEDIRQTKIDHLVYFYHTELFQILSKFPTIQEIPSLHELQNMLQERQFITFFAGLLMQPSMIVEAKELPTKPSRDIDRDRGKVSAIYKNSKVERAIKYLLPLLEKQGVLD